MWDVSDYYAGSEFAIHEETKCENLREFDFWPHDRPTNHQSCSVFILEKLHVWAPNLKILLSKNLHFTKQVTIEHKHLQELQLCDSEFKAFVTINSPSLESLNMKSKFPVSLESCLNSQIL